MPSLLEDVLLGIFKEDPRKINFAAFELLNYILYALLAAILFMIATNQLSFHVYILLFLSIGLFFSVNWFLSELKSGDNEAIAVTGETGAQENIDSTESNKKTI